MARTPADVRDSITESIEWLKFALRVYEKQIKRESEDLEFQVAEGAWPDDVKAMRGAQPAIGTLPALPSRPMISVATLDEPVALVSAEERKAHLGVTIHPLNEDATDETAQVLQGLYRAIETDSRAGNVRSWSFNRALWCGRGVYRVSKRFDPEGGHPFDQKIVLERILYQENVVLDPFAIQPDWSDMTRAQVLEDVPWPVYKRRYKKSKLAKAGVDGLSILQGQFPDWIKQGDGEDETRTVRVCEEWRVTIEEQTIVLLDDGSTAPEDKIPEGRTVMQGDEARSATVETRRVTWRIINCQEELEPEHEWDGKYIPLIPTIGRELQPIKGRRQWFGMVANAKDAVRLTDYAASGAIEMAALEPKAPFELDPEQIENYEEWWKTSNVRNHPYLPHHRTIRGEVVPPPQRVQVDVGRLGPSMQLLGMGRQFVQAATAIYPPALGENTPAHRSGRAITALQDQSIQANTPYLDNLATVSMPYEAIVVLDLIPHVYDRPGRVAHILDEQDKAQPVMLNAPFVTDPRTGQPRGLPTNTPAQQQLAQQAVQNPDNPAKQYDLNKGRYGVSVQIGKSRVSRLAEGNDALSNLMQSDPALVPILGPEWAKFQDFPGADTVSKLLTKMRDHTMPWLSDTPQGAAAMDPQKLQAENMMLKQQLQKAGMVISTKQVEQQGKVQVATIQETAETERNRADNETKITVAALTSKVETLQNMMQLFFEERARLGTQAADARQAGLDRAHDAAMATGDHVATMQQGVAALQPAPNPEMPTQPLSAAPPAQPSNGDGGGGPV